MNIFLYSTIFCWFFCIYVCIFCLNMAWLSHNCQIKSIKSNIYSPMLKLFVAFVGGFCLTRDFVTMGILSDGGFCHPTKFFMQQNERLLFSFSFTSSAKSLNLKITRLNFVLSCCPFNFILLSRY